MRIKLAVFALMACCVSSVDASAEPGYPADLGHCTDDTTIAPGDIISACTGFITRAYEESWNLQYVPRAITYQAAAYERLGKDDEAEKILKIAIVRNRTDPIVWEAWGDLLEKSKGPDMRMKVVDAMIQANPGNADILNSACWIRAKHNEQLDIAIGNCYMSLQIRPGDANTLDSKAFAHFRKGDFADAIRDTTSALAIDPKLAGSLYIRGLAKQKSGDAVGGSADIAAAEALDPKIAETYAGYGVTQ